jgi:hypothetical protein
MPIKKIMDLAYLALEHWSLYNEYTFKRILRYIDYRFAHTVTKNGMSMHVAL